MIVIKCPACGKKVVWDDFQPLSVNCPQCRQDLNVRTSLKESIERRMDPAGKKILRCPHCSGIVSGRWLTKCEKCGYRIVGPWSFSSWWPFSIALAVAYLMFALYYVLYIR